MAITVEMKHLIAVCLIFWTCAYQATSRTLYESSVAKAHEQWMSQYGHSYSDDAEKQKRFKIFMDNLEYIEKFNNGQNKSYKLGLNQFSDLTEEEFIASHTGLKISSLPHSSSGSATPLTLTDVPPSIDWKEKGAVTDVKYQGQCAVEGIYQIKTKKLVSLSEQQLLDCDRNNNGCDGGFMDNAFKYIIENNGIASESDYPYQGGSGTCQSDQIQSAVEITGFVDVVANNEEQLLQAVATQPVSVAISINENFKSYNGGIFDGPCDANNLNHAVTLIGYGRREEDGTKYWLIKNSWGESWGENGYMKLQRETGQPEGLCGIAMKPSYPTI